MLSGLSAWLGGLKPAPAGHLPAGDAPLAAAGAAAKEGGRRDRLGGDDRTLQDVLAGKLMHAWLQNRHQTLYPLSINLATLGVAHQAALAQWAALTLVVTRHAAPNEAAITRVAAWLRGAGADAASQQAFQSALTAPAPLDTAMRALAAQNMAVYAYVAALVAADKHSPASAPFLDFVATWFALPATVIRSAVRRYRP